MRSIVFFLASLLDWVFVLWVVHPLIPTPCDLRDLLVVCFLAWLDAPLVPTCCLCYRARRVAASKIETIQPATVEFQRLSDLVVAAVVVVAIVV